MSNALKRNEAMKAVSAKRAAAQEQVETKQVEAKAPKARKPKTPQVEAIVGMTPLGIAPATEQVESAPVEQAPVAAPVEQVESAPAKPAKEAKPLPTCAEALAKAKAEFPSRYANVVEVVEITKKGEPKRVVIECGDPQTKQGTDGKPMSVCEGTREIAVQDLFQVSCCAACADRKVRKARRNRAKVRDKSLKAALRAAKGER